MIFSVSMITFLALIISAVLFTKRFIFYLSSCLRLANFGGNRIFITNTSHTRYAPIHNAFKYQMFLFGIRIEAIDTIKSSWIFGIDSYALFSIKTSDFSHGSSKSLKLYDRIIDTLKILQVDTSHITGIELLTIPRVLGYSFNPLSTIFIYHSSNQPTTLLEVSNTFSEKHLYVCKQSTTSVKSPKHNYDAAYTLQRQFHVSPFNNRSGVYECNIKYPIESYLDIHLQIDKYNDTQDKLMTARLWGRGYVLDQWSLLYILLVFPMNTFLTLPRIGFEAFKLHYLKGLDVFEKQRQVNEFGVDGGSIQRQKPSLFEIWCFKRVCLVLKEGGYQFKFLMMDYNKSEYCSDNTIEEIMDVTFVDYSLMKLVVSGAILVGLEAQLKEVCIFKNDTDIIKLVEMLQKCSFRPYTLAGRLYAVTSQAIEDSINWTFKKFIRYTDDQDKDENVVKVGQGEMDDSSDGIDVAER